MKKKKKYKISELNTNEISLVKNPAVPDSIFLMQKSEDTMTIQDSNIDEKIAFIKSRDYASYVELKNLFEGIQGLQGHENYSYLEKKLENSIDRTYEMLKNNPDKKVKPVIRMQKSENIRLNDIANASKRLVAKKSAL